MSRGVVAAGRGLRCLRFSTSLPPRSLSLPTQQRHHSQSTASQAPQIRKSRPKAFPIVILGSILGCSTIYYYFFSAWSQTPESGLLNDQTFVPYKIIAREVISPTSFVLTVSPHHLNVSAPVTTASLPYLWPGTHTWRYPQWSVEFKQPQVQIARHYTALPPREGEEDQTPSADGGGGILRFYVRTVQGGEMSSYMTRLGIGSDVWLRGPHAGFDVLQRLGCNRDVVFLAGGTGIAPGMQVARAVLEHKVDSRVMLLWAVRDGGEVRGGKEQQQQQQQPVRPIPWWRFWAVGREPVEMEGDGAGAGLDGASSVMRQLREMKARYGSRLRIQISIDEEGMKFQEAHLQKALSHSTNALKHSSPKKDTGCQLHDPAILQHASEFDEFGTLDCSCPPIEQQQQQQQQQHDHDAPGPGKNLFIVSGPEGFVEHYAGPKVWHAGKQLQGPVGGVAGRLQRRWPHLAQDWLVLKL